MLNKLYVYGVLLITLLPISSLDATAHELNKNTTLRAHIKQREQYDRCVHSAAKNAVLEKQCRKAYAKSRLFTVQQLHHIYMEHPLEAEELYDDALIGLRGRVYSLGTATLGAPEAVLSLDALGLSGVRIEFSPQSAKQFKQLKQGDTVHVVAICKGMLQEGFVRIVNAEFMQ